MLWLLATIVLFLAITGVALLLLLHSGAGLHGKTESKRAQCTSRSSVRPAGLETLSDARQESCGEREGTSDAGRARRQDELDDGRKDP
jgi:hypothetical protein